MLGWAQVFSGEQNEGIIKLQEGLDDWRAEELIFVPYFLGLKAEAVAEIGRVDEAIDILTEALKLSEKGNQRCYASELHRLKGVFLLQKECADKAEDNLQQALNIARRQQAKSLELRAAVSLGRLWQQRSKQAEARELLGEVYGWFTEGFDTADLRDAKALLEELREARLA